MVPTLLPFSFHWYVGEIPPNCGVALKVTEPPSQIVDAVVMMDTEGVTLAIMLTSTLDVMLLEQPPDARLFATAV